MFHYFDPWQALEERELRVSPTDNDSYGATQNVERSTKRERDWEEARKGNGAGTSLAQVETISLALRLRESRRFRSALKHHLPQPEDWLNGAGNGDPSLAKSRNV